MIRRRPSIRGIAFWAAALVSAMVALAAQPCAAQPADSGLKILFSETAHDPAPTITNLRLRPNTSQQFYLYVRNTGKAAREAAVELRAGDKAVPGTRAEVKIPVGTTQVSLPKPPAPAPGEKPAAPAALPAPLRVRLLDPKTNKPFDEEEILVARPAEYVKVNSVTFNPGKKGGKNRFAVELEALPTFSGPPARVELVLRPDRIEAFVPGQEKEGTYGGTLSKPGEKLPLYAENIQFRDDSDHRGYVYLTIDGYERAFMFETTFLREGGPGRPRQVTERVIRLESPRAALPSASTRIGLEVDNARTGEMVELGFDRDDNKRFEENELKTFSEDRQQLFVLGPPGPDGAIQLQSVAQDWNPLLDTTDVFDERMLRVRMLNAEKKALEVRDAVKNQITEEPHAILATLTLDGNPPKGVKFIKSPASLVQGKPLSLQATASIPKSGIKEVIFYLGKPVDRKMPPNAPKVDAKATDPKGTTWAAVFPVPTDKVGDMDVTVQFTSGVGLTASATTSVLVEEPPKEAAPGKASKASIRGVVVEGDRPQAGLAVALVDLKGGDPKGAETNKKGEFVFADLAPGKYRLSAEKSASRTKGEQIVQLKEGEQKTGVTIKLVRK